MAKKEITDFFDKAKKATVDVARVVADTAVAVADKTQEVVATTTAKIQDEIQEKKEAAIKACNNSLFPQLSYIPYMKHEQNQ